MQFEQKQKKKSILHKEIRRNAKKRKRTNSTESKRLSHRINFRCNFHFSSGDGLFQIKLGYFLFVFLRLSFTIDNDNDDLNAIVVFVHHKLRLI